MKTRGAFYESTGSAGFLLLLGAALFFGLALLGAFAKLCIAAFDLVTGSASWLLSSAAHLVTSLL